MARGKFPAQKIVAGNRDVADGIALKIQNEQIGIDVFRFVINRAVPHRSENRNIRITAGEKKLPAVFGMIRLNALKRMNGKPFRQRFHKRTHIVGTTGPVDVDDHGLRSAPLIPVITVTVERINHSRTGGFFHILRIVDHAVKRHVTNVQLFRNFSEIDPFHTG